MPKASKRQRKHRASQSLRGKQASAAQQQALDLLAEPAPQLEGVDEGDGDLGSNALILPAGKGAAAAAADAQAAAAPPPSKAQLKKLKQVAMKKQRREQLSQVLSQLASSSLPDEQLGLLRPLHQRGARETKKQRLRRALKLQRAGLAAEGADDELLRPRRVHGVHGPAGDSDSGSGSDGEAGEESSSDDGAAELQQQQQQQSSSSDDEDEPEQRPTKQARVDGGAGLQPNGAPAAAPPAPSRKQQLAALRAQAATLKAQAKAEAGDAAVDEAAAEEAAAVRKAAAERAAAAAAGPTRVVSLQRPPGMEAARRELPIIGLEQEIMEGITHHDVVVLCGETGCGKTTQVPQFLLEAGFGCRDFPERAGAVCVTQPRRVAAISTAQRVAAELGSPLGGLVGYQVRHDRRVGASSAVRFLTDGVLLRQLQSDFLLPAYSVVLLDEAHERSLNTDILLGMLSRLVPLRRRLHEQWKAAGCPPAAQGAPAAAAAAAAAGGSGGGTPGPVFPLKLVIMSATLRTSDFTENHALFPVPPPVLSVPARQFPVTVHFAKRTELHDYLGAAVRKVCRIHRELPAGGILLFLTGQREVAVAARRIRQAFAPRQRRGGGSGAAAAPPTATAAPGGAAEDDADDGAAAGADAAELAADAADAALEADLAAAANADAAAAAGLDDFELGEADEDEEQVHVMGGEGWTPEELAAAEARFEAQYGLRLAGAGAPAAGAAATPGGPGQQEPQQQQQQQQQAAAPVHVLPLYAMLPQAQQAEVFRPVPPGHRLVVVATNVAETSITIPGIRYVVDAGRSKRKLLQLSGGGAVARYAVDWISKAAAEQRAGRAGRTGPGHVYRLFSSAHFNDSFSQHTEPEIANTPLEGVVLLLKAMGVDKVANFPFPSPPEPGALLSATRCLLALSAMAPGPRPPPGRPQPAAAAGAGPLTALGRVMAVFPVTPRHSRMLLQLAVWQQQAAQQAAALARPPSVGQPAQLGGVSAAAAVRALPYAVALAAVLSLESPFMHLDALHAEGESAAAAAEAERGGAAAAAAGDAGDGGSDAEPDGGDEAGSRGAAAQAAKAAKAAAKRKMQAAAAAHARFRSSSGDAISALNALCAYEAAAAAGQAERFCADSFLHARHLREAAQLRQQLGRTLLQLQQQGSALAAAGAPGGGGAGAEAQALLRQLVAAVQTVGPQQLTQPLAPPSPGVLEVLRRALAAGWCDQVSRRVRSADYIARLASEGRLARHATRYTPACLAPSTTPAAAAAVAGEPGGEPEPSGEVFLHPRSCLASLAPEFVVYQDLVASPKRTYMALVTAVEPSWLADVGSSLCSVSPPLSEPAPFYQPQADAVLAWHDATYSQHAWPLPRVLRPHPEPATRAAVFAAALFAGKVLPSMAGLAPALVAPAASAARPELAGLPRVGELLGALQGRQVFSRASLAAAWAQQPDFLKPQLAAWLQRPQRALLEGAWQQLQQEAAAGAAAGSGGGGSSKKRKKQRGSKGGGSSSKGSG